MKKKFIRVMFFGALALTTFSYVGCKDYDDDIDRLEQKITENADAIAKINELIEGGSVITKVENITGGVEVTLSNGKTFTVKNGDAGKDGTQWTIGDDGYWYENGKKSEYKAKGDKGDQGPAGEQGPAGGQGSAGEQGPAGEQGEKGDTYIPGEDGYWYKNEVKPENKTDKTWIVPGVVSVADMGDYYIFSNLKNADGTTTSATIYKYSATFVSSLVHVTSNINEDLGDIVFLPVIGFDDNSTGKTPIYEYNSSEQPKYRTLVNGWAEYEYKLNPANVNPKYFEGLGFIEQTATITTRAEEEAEPVEIGLPLSKISVNEKGKLVVKASAGNNKDNVNAFKMFINDSETTDYDDPDGKPMKESSKYGEAGKVNMLAYQVKNTSDQLGTDANINVVSDFVATKRMVVMQEETSIAVPVSATTSFVDPTVVAPALKELTDLYTIADVTTKEEIDAAKLNSYLSDNQKVPVTMKLMYTESLDLNTIMKGIATQFHTNTDFDADESQYLLTDLGFENITFKYTPMSYRKAEVDQTGDYLKLDGSTISVIGQQYAAIDREPVVKVEMSVDGKLVMTKLLKIQIADKEQLTEEFTNTDLTEQTLGCAAIYGGGSKLAAKPFKDATADPAYDNVVSGLKIDFDQYFNALEVSKEKFVSYYGGTPDVAVAFTPQGKTEATPFTDVSIDPENLISANNLIIDYSNITGTGITLNNNVYFGLKNQLKAGTYTIVFTYSTANKAPKYKSFKITATLVIKDPVHTWEYNPSTWKDKEYMIGYGQPTNLEYTGPFLMKATLEDGFQETWDGCGEWDFEIVDTEKVPASEVKIETVYGANNKPSHVLTIIDKKWLDKKIRIRAVEYIATPRANKQTARKIDNYVSTGTTPTSNKEFDIMFVNPVAYAAVSANWYLVDKANTSLLDKGAYLPIYRLFKLYDVKRGEANGMMFNGGAKEPWAEIVKDTESGKSLFKMHQVEVSYKLSTKNTAYVKEHATILPSKENKEVGLLKWNNDKGVAVGTTPQPIIIDVTIKNTWNEESAQTSEQTHEITVYVKKADTKYEMPTTGFLGSKDAPEGVGSYKDVTFKSKDEK